MSEHHDEIGRFMAAIQPGGAAEAAKLSGLSLQAGLALAIQRHQFSEYGLTSHPYCFTRYCSIYTVVWCGPFGSMSLQRSCRSDCDSNHMIFHFMKGPPNFAAPNITPNLSTIAGVWQGFEMPGGDGFRERGAQH